MLIFFFFINSVLFNEVYLIFIFLIIKNFFKHLYLLLLKLLVKLYLKIKTKLMHNFKLIRIMLYYIFFKNFKNSNKPIFKRIRIKIKFKKFNFYYKGKFNFFKVSLLRLSFIWIDFKNIYKYWNNFKLTKIYKKVSFFKFITIKISDAYINFLLTISVFFNSNSGLWLFFLPIGLLLKLLSGYFAFVFLIYSNLLRIIYYLSNLKKKMKKLFKKINNRQKKKNKLFFLKNQKCLNKYRF